MKGPTTDLKKQTGKTAVEQVIEQVRTWVNEGTYPPGSRLPSEAELMEQVGVGRSSVREAMKILSAMGAVEIKRGNGTFIAQEQTLFPKNCGMTGLPKPTSFRELVDARDALERAILGLAIRAAKPESIRRLEECNRKTLQAYENHQDIQTMIDLEIEFHHQLGCCSENALLAHLYDHILAMSLPYISDNFHNTDAQGYVAYFIHQRMVDAMRFRDQEMAQRVVTEATAEFAKNNVERTEPDEKNCIVP